jgi:hypothetical protein
MAAASASTVKVIPINEIDDIKDALLWFKDLLPATAKEELALEQSQGNLADPVTTFVDGRKSDDIASVKIFGNIRYVSSIGPIEQALSQLEAFVAQKAPRKTGWYDESMQWVVNGEPVRTRPTAEQIGARGNVMLMDLAPYASWLEVYYPTGILFAAYTSLARSYGKRLAVHYGYANPDHFGGQKWKPGQPRGKHPYMVPYVLIGSPGSTVKPGTKSVRNLNSKRARKTADKRAGRGHRLGRGIGRSSGKGPKA